MNGKEESADDKIYDYIVIGSGFGGSVSAMRLAQKGYEVLVLEKGKRYTAEDFPKTNWHIKKYLWVPVLRCFGFLKLTFFKKLFVVSGVGVGGGSLVYANTLLEPTDNFYNQLPVDGPDWAARLKPHFKMAKHMLGVTPAQGHYSADSLLKAVAADLGKGHTYHKVDVGVYYNEDKTPQDPYFDGEGPLRTPCIECAGCMIGCRHNAKNTLDKNYLWFAEKYGAFIQPLMQTEIIEWDKTTQLYTIHCRTPYSSRIVQRYKSRGLIISGGVLGTTDLLFKQKHKYQTLPLLSSRLGENLLSNSESISGVIGADQKLNHGVAISSIIQPNDYTQIELCKFPDRSGSLFRLAYLAAGEGRLWKRIAQTLLLGIRKPKNLWKWIKQGHDPKHAVVVLVMQQLKNALRFQWTGRKISLTTDKNTPPIPVFIPSGFDVTQRLAAKSNGVAVSAMTETFLNMATTAHILGGCPMGKSVDEGVVNEKFQVHNYPQMYILDGSIVPANLGVNPSLTITALAEYAMEQIPVKGKLT